MKKIKISLMIMTGVLLAAVGIFWACEKGSEISVNSKKLEASFVAKNYNGTCLKVDVFRNKNNNILLTTTSIDNDSTIETAGFVSKTIELKPVQIKEKESFFVEIPGDAIYWLIPLDGNEPVKFTPNNNAKTTTVDGVNYRCRCGTDSRIGRCSNSYDRICCTVGTTSIKNGVVSLNCTVNNLGDCDKCSTVTVATSGGTTTAFVGSTLLVQCNSLTINGITYN